MTTDTDTAPAKLASLDRLHIWVNDPANRTAWREVLLARDAARVESDRAVSLSRLPSRGVSVEEQAEARQDLADAEAMVELARLAEDFAASTRLRLTVCLGEERPEEREGEGDTDDASRDTAVWMIRQSADEIMHALTAVRFRDPGEVARNATAALYDLNNRHRCMRADLTTSELRWWADHTTRAMRVIDAAPRIAEPTTD